MKINNAMDFYHFVKNSGLININPEVTSMCQCIEEFGRMCACDPPAAKNAKLNQCRNLYVNFVHRAPQFKDILLPKTSDNLIEFCIDNQSIIVINR
jgi:hypothetical protein